MMKSSSSNLSLNLRQNQNSDLIISNEISAYKSMVVSL